MKTKNLVLTALFGAIIIIMAFTPFIGYIPLGFTRATIIHVPVIIASIILGPKKGGFLGLIFGLTSLYNNTVAPTVTSFVFSPFVGGNFLSLVICLVPRVLVGIVPFYVNKIIKNESLGLVLAGLCGSLTNTLLVMNMIFVFFGQRYAEASGRSFDVLYKAILVIIGINGVPEAIVASVLTLSIVKVVKKIGGKA